MAMKKGIQCLDVNGVAHSFTADELSFRPSVYGILINEEQKVLMIDHRGKFCFPGGGVEIGENIVDALRREVFEETGLNVLKSQIVECDDSFFLIPYENEPVHSILLFFLCKFEPGEIKDENVDDFEKEYAQKAEWLRIADILKMDNLVFPQMKEILERI